MKAKERYRILGEAIMGDYLFHGKKEVVVTISDASILKYTYISVGTHLRISFTEHEMKKIKKGKT